MDLLTQYSDADIHNITIIQRLIKDNFTKIRNLNDRMNITYNNVYSIMKRINSNFVLGLITQYEYNSELNKLDSQLNNLKRLPRPFTFYDKLENSMETITYIINNINDNLFEVAMKTGTDKIFDAIHLYYRYTLKDLFQEISKEDKNLIYFYHNVFIPESIDLYHLNEIDLSKKDSIVPYSSKTKLSRKQYDFKNMITCKSSAKCFYMFKKNKSFIEKIRGSRLYIPIKNDKLGINDMIVFDGYFLEDPLNISRVGGVLEKKNLNLLEKIDCLDINNYFKNAFIQQISIRDFILYDTDSLIDRCNKAYTELQNLKKKTISTLVKEFLLSDFLKQRDILTLFLLMKDDVDTQYLAYLMYDMITNESYLLKPQPLAEQVFNSLHWSVQKLFKVAIKRINKNTNKLLNFNEEEISYEKRIFLMRTSDYVKSKAMEKYKEYCKSGEASAKCVQYIDGILKIPFSIYRKEPILAFLDEYRNSLNTFINSYLIEAKKTMDNNYTNKSIIKNYSLCQELSTNSLIKKTCGNVLGNKDKTLKSQEIDYFINQFNSNMVIESEGQFDIDNIIKYFKKEKKEKLVDFVRLINEDLLKKNNGGKKNVINESLTKTKMLVKLGSFITNPDNKDIVQKYINYLDEERKNKILSEDYEHVANLNNNFFFLNSEWFDYKKDYKKYLNDSNKILDDAVYHQEEAKIQIKRIIAQWINGEMKGYCFGFEGPPGTGKTSLAKKGISKCLRDNDGGERPFAFIALGGSSNGATIEGHSYTYVGSTWGRIVDILMETKCMNPIIYIDELDKVSKTENGKEIIGILTHLTDPSQNDEYVDKYFSGIKLDLSKVLFIFSYNDYSLLDPILADRIHRVKFQKLNKYEKVHIVNNYILPELLETIGFNKDDIIFSKKILEYIITSYTQEAGVRKLREKIFEIVREINLRYLMDSEDKKITIPLKVSIEFIEEVFHSKPKYTVKTIAPKPFIGLVNGLYATVSGIGGLTIIESFKTPSDSKLSLELTGQQGDVMKESMKVAKTVAWNLLPEEIKKKIYQEMNDNGNFGIHLHCPEGATPKDGPSAGAAITMSIVSLLTGVRVLNTIALTGEIDLNGSIHEIGGLESKVEGGKVAGAKKILYPRQNEKDIKLIREKDNIIDDSIEVIAVDNIWQVLDICLEENDLVFNNYTEP